MHAINPNANYLIWKTLKYVSRRSEPVEDSNQDSCDNQQNSVEKSDIATPASFHIKLIS